MATFASPQPTPIYRLVHVDCLATLLTRGVLHAPNATPTDGLPYRTIHDTSVQANRRIKPVPCGPGGTVHDYLPFYFDARSVMLLKLKTGQVTGYAEGQEPLVYLVSTAQAVAAAGNGFVFTDGHGLATFTQWFTDLARLDAIDWPLLAAKYWNDTPQDNDRQRRKQSEFLIWQSLDWGLICSIGVLNGVMKTRIERILGQHPHRKQISVQVRPDLYY